MCRDNYDMWNMLSKARNENRLFQNLKWPRDKELVHLYIPFVFACQPIVYVREDLTIYAYAESTSK